jgi:Carboxypeptidase regulatory-like domain/TonB dependent receptor
MIRTNRLVATALLAAAIAFTPEAAIAQTLYGSIVGTVNDPTGAAVPNAAITATNKQTGQVRQATSNEAGGYIFAAVQPGIYEIKFSKEGFRPVAEPSVEVTANNTSRADVALQVGSVSDSVTIEAAGAILQTDSATVRSEMQGKTLVNLPVPVGRNYQNVLVTIPGFSPPANAHSVPTNPSRALAANVNGTPTAGVLVRIDGAASQQTWLPHIAAYVPALESIETVDVVTNSFSAEQGQAGGAAVNVSVKSGTNDIHGSAFEYNVNNKLLAKPFTYALLNQGNLRNPKYIFNQYGGTIGGPIVKNKLFYFGSFEGSPRREFANNTGTLPTAAMRNGDFSDGTSIYGTRGLIYDPATGDQNTGSGRTLFPNNVIPAARISDVAKRIQGFIPAVGATTFADNNYFATGGFLFDRRTLDTKINYNINEKWTVYGRYSFLNYKMNNPGMLGDIVGPGISPSGGNTGDASGLTHSMTIATTYVLTPHLVLDANFGYTRYNTLVEQPLDGNIGLDVLKIPGTNGKRRFEGGWPRFTLSGFTTLGVPDSFMPYERKDPQTSYVANMNWTKGSHQIRFGFDLFKQDLNHLQAEFAGQNHGAQGGFNFTGGPTQINGGPAASSYNTWAAFLLGLPNNYGTTYQVPDTYGTRTKLFSSYIQDTWQFNPKLTINYGLRYTNIPMPTREDRGMERYDFVNNKMLMCGLGSVPTDCGTKQSKLLFAPSLGLAFRPNDKTVIRAGFGINYDPLNLIRALRTNFPILLILNGNAANSFVPVSRIEEGIPIPQIPNVSSGVLDLPNSYAVASTGDKFQRAYIMSWNFTVQRQLGKGFAAQAGYVASRTVRQTQFLDLNAGQVIGAGRDGRPFFPNFGRQTTTTLVDALGHSIYDSLQMKLDRRMAAGLTLGFAYTWSKALGVCCNSSNDGGPAIHARQYLGLARSVLSFDRPHNFQSTFAWGLPFGKGKSMLASGPAAKIAGGWQINGLLSMYSGSPFSVAADGAGLNLPGSTQRADQIGEPNQLGGYGRGQAWYDWRQFTSVTGARFGTAGFNTLRVPGIRNFDMGIFRNFQITERFGLQFRGEALNVTNTPQLGGPSNNISSLRTDPNGNFLGGVFEVTGVANTGRDGLVQRTFRLGARLSF